MADLLRAGGHDEISFVGTPEGVEARLVPEAGLPFYGVPARGFDRAHPLSLLLAVAVFLGSVVRSIGLMRRLRPDVVVGFGGYVSLPVGFAAVLMRRPLVLHEQNSVPGLANRVLSRWATAVAITYAGSKSHLRHPDRAIHTGNPVRSQVLAAKRETGRAVLGVSADATLLLVFGGSRGARHINSAVAAARFTLLALPGVVVVHVAGREEYADVKALTADLDADAPRYKVVDYIDDMGSALAAADLVIARAGATSIAELTALGKPSVLVPYPYATEDHQTLNAVALSDGGGALLVKDEALDTPEFVNAVTALLVDTHRRATMAAASQALGRPDAGDRVVGVLLEAVETSRT